MGPGASQVVASVVRMWPVVSVQVAPPRLVAFAVVFAMAFAMTLAAAFAVVAALAAAVPVPLAVASMTGRLCQVWPFCSRNFFASNGFLLKAAGTWGRG